MGNLQLPPTVGRHGLETPVPRPLIDPRYRLNVHPERPVLPDERPLYGPRTRGFDTARPSLPESPGFPWRKRSINRRFRAVYHRGAQRLPSSACPPAPPRWPRPNPRTLLASSRIGPNRTVSIPDCKLLMPHIYPGFPRWIASLMTFLGGSAIRINAIPSSRQVKPVSPCG